MINTIIGDGKGGGYSAHLHKRNGDTGLVVFTLPREESFSKTKPLLNPTFGADMAQAVTFGGTPEKIHNGGTSTEWGATAVAGAWNFADAGKTSLTNGNTADEALFTDSGGGTVDMSNYTAFTGKIQLDAYSPANNSIIISFELAGVAQGNTVDLNDYIDTGLIGSEQSFAIPKADLGIGTITIDELRITLVKGGGPKPTFRFDDLQIEETGNPLTYEISATSGTKYHISELIFSVADTGTGGTAYAYNKLGAIASLSIGVVVTFTINQETLFSINIRQLSTFLEAGGVVTNVIDDGTNTFYTVNVDFEQTTPIILDSRQGDTMTVTINDDLSGLLLFEAFVRGREQPL